jgi:hypothetical protein
LTRDPSLAQRLGERSLADSRHFSWSERARKIAAILLDRLAATPVTCSAWNRAQNRDWLLQSRRWAAHLIRKRSWVLPPRLAVVPSTKN